MIPVEVTNGDGTRDTYQSINEVAGTLGIPTMEVYTMIANRKAKLGKPVRKVLSIPPEGKVGLRSRCIVEILNEDGSINETFNSISDAAEACTGKGSTAGYIYT